MYIYPLDPTAVATAVKTVKNAFEDEKERVRRGAVLLDELGPTHWWERIDIETFDMQSVDRDILGFLYESKQYGMAALGLFTPDLVKNGLESSFDDYYLDNSSDQTADSLWSESYDRLTKFWMDEIITRITKIPLKFNLKN